MPQPLHIFTWHVHGSYLYYLSHIPHRLYLPVNRERSHGYGGRTPSYPWPERVIEVPLEEVPRLRLDCILFQAHQHYLEDQFRILSPAQRALPKLFLEHDPPREHPTDTRHPVRDPGTLLVHVTAFNELMWDAGPTPTRVIEHGVTIPPGVRYLGGLERGVTVINQIRKRGRRLGYDLWERFRGELPLDLIGMEWQEAGGIGEVCHRELPAFLANYRFFFNPIRYTSLGLAVCEAMATGLPIVGLATTEMATVIPNGIAGFMDTNPRALSAPMRALLADREMACAMGKEARRIARQRFSIDRFVDDWNRLLREIT